MAFMIDFDCYCNQSKGEFIATKLIQNDQVYFHKDAQRQKLFMILLTSCKID